MNKSAFVRARIAPELKEEAEHILEEWGITPTQAVTMLYKFVVREQEWPVPLRKPNAQTQKTFEETDKEQNLTISKDKDEMFKKLGI